MLTLPQPLSKPSREQLVSHPTSRSNNHSPHNSNSSSNLTVYPSQPQSQSQSQASTLSTPRPSPSSRPEAADGLRDNNLKDRLKSFKVGLDDPAWKVLPAALKKYKINNDD